MNESGQVSGNSVLGKFLHVWQFRNNGECKYFLWDFDFVCGVRKVDGHFIKMIHTFPGKVSASSTHQTGSFTILSTWLLSSRYTTESNTIPLTKACNASITA